MIPSDLISADLVYAAAKAAAEAPKYFPVAMTFLDRVSNAGFFVSTDEADEARETWIGTRRLRLADRYIARKEPEGCIYVHRWHNSDPDDLHDHPWQSCSVVLAGGYWEVTTHGRYWRAPGDITFRSELDLHRIEIDLEQTRGRLPESLFITGPEVREWGFHTKDGFVVGRDYRQQLTRP